MAKKNDIEIGKKPKLVIATNEPINTSDYVEPELSEEGRRIINEALDMLFERYDIAETKAEADYTPNTHDLVMVINDFYDAPWSFSAYQLAQMLRARNVKFAWVNDDFKNRIAWLLKEK